MTQKTLCELTNTSPSTMCRFLRGECYLPIDQLAEVFKVLGVSLDHTLGITEGESKTTPEIADTAIVGYIELIAEKDKIIEMFKQSVSDKERLIEAKDKVILVQEKLIEQLTERLLIKG